MSVMEMPYELLVAESDLIVLGKVKSIEQSVAGECHARAKVLEVWKGNPTDEVVFLASPTWTCDISEAEPGETSALFLKHRRSGPPEITHAGRGRMPLRMVGKKSYATLWSEVVLPPTTPLIPGPSPEYPFIRSVELDVLKNLIERAHASWPLKWE